MELPHVDGVTHRYVDAGGLHVHLAEAGNPDGEPLLMLHGWPQHWYLWRDLVPLMGDRYRLLMPDLRGCGWTEAPASGYEKEQFALDQVALLDALGIERVKLIGHDWGGYVGFLIGLLHPERVSAYVACNIIHPWPKPDVRAVLGFWRMSYQLPMLIGPWVTRRRGFIKFVLRTGSRDGVFSDADAEIFEATYREPDGARAATNIYRTFQRHDLPLLLKRHWTKYRLSVPTLVIYGTGDFAIQRRQLEGYEPYADDMRIVEIDGTGHFVVDAEPARVAELALDFFAAR